jgi:hypothetical protein
MSWPPHPKDEWVEATSLGATETQFRSGAEREIAKAKAKYVEGQITIEEFEAIVEDVLTGGR